MKRGLPWRPGGSKADARGRYDGPRRRWLVIMVKAPVAGRVKTRLAGAIGPVQASGFYRHTATAVIRRLASDQRWHTCLAISPDNAPEHTVWPRTAGHINQGGGGLGERMQRLIEAMPPGPVLVVGTDIPAVRPSHIAHAFALVERCGVVFGPATDGGFWLVGQRRTPKCHRPFTNVRWSTDAALADCVANLERKPALADRLSDVDTSEEFDAVSPWSGRVVLPPGGISFQTNM